MTICAVIFDLDGVIVSTDECHYQAWKRLAYEEGILFDRDINMRLRGVSRMQSLEIVLERASRFYQNREKEVLAARKNGYYRELIASLTPANLLPGVFSFMEECRRRGLRLAVGSSSRNTSTILERVGLGSYFDAVADGNDIVHSKPDPEVFLVAARRLNAEPRTCVVIEDAQAGIKAARAAGMRVIGVGAAAADPKADLRARSLDELDIDEMMRIG